MARLFPAEARTHRVAGEVVAECLIDGEGRFSSCDILSENPPGLGFGDSTQKLSKLFQMKAADEDGAAVAGRKLRLPVRWRGGPGG